MRDIIQLLREKSREIASDYPNIDKDLEPWEHLWAISSSYEGTKLANDDLHEFIKFLIGKLDITLIEALDEFNCTKETHGN